MKEGGYGAQLGGIRRAVLAREITESQRANTCSLRGNPSSLFNVITPLSSTTEIRRFVGNSTIIIIVHNCRRTRQNDRQYIRYNVPGDNTYAHCNSMSGPRPTWFARSSAFRKGRKHRSLKNRSRRCRDFVSFMGGRGVRNKVFVRFTGRSPS